MTYHTLESLLYSLIAKVRKQQGKDKEPTAAVIDTQSVKSAGHVLTAGVSTAGRHDKKTIQGTRKL